MNSNKRPISVLLVACAYLAVGSIGFVAHFPKLSALHSDDVWIELTELLAIVAGVFLLCGHNWTRWLALAWMAFHVVISFPAPVPIAVHSLFFVVIAWALFRPAAGRYFRT